MGMFDWIQCEMSLPDGSSPLKREFQTKSFDNTMSKYVINTKGYLYEHRWDYRLVEDETHFLKGYIEEVEDSFQQIHLTDYHGDIIFYDSKKIGEVWRDYYARFTDGKVSRMWYVDAKF